MAHWARGFVDIIRFGVRRNTLVAVHAAPLLASKSHDSRATPSRPLSAYVGSTLAREQGLLTGVFCPTDTDGRVFHDPLSADSLGDDRPPPSGKRSRHESASRLSSYPLDDSMVRASYRSIDRSARSTKKVVVLIPTRAWANRPFRRTRRHVIVRRPRSCHSLGARQGPRHWR